MIRTKISTLAVFALAVTPFFSNASATSGNNGNGCNGGGNNKNDNCNKKNDDKDKDDKGKGCKDKDNDDKGKGCKDKDKDKDGKGCHDDKHDHGGNCGGNKPKDTTPPVITCPGEGKLFCGSPTGPDALGWATATDDTDTDVTITYKDQIVEQACGAERFDHTILRKWKAVDNNCNVATCVQTIHVLKNIVSLDAAPGTCPNDFEAGCGFFPITIAGGPGFDVHDIQLSSLKVWAEDCVGGFVKPADVCFGDVTSWYFPSEECGCTTAGADGTTDVTLWVKKSKLVERFGLCALPKGSSFRLIVSGNLKCDGCEFIGTDCITIQ